MELSQISMAPALAATLARASEFTAASGTGEIMLEHILLGLCDDPDAVAVLDSSSVSVDRLRDEVSAFLASAYPGGSPPQRSLAVSADATRILEAAAAAARGGRRRDINGAIVLAAIVGDGRSIAAQILQSQGLTFDEAIRALQRALSQPAAPPPPAEDVLARARERVQSRSAPSLREIMGDAQRPAAPPPPQMPMSSPAVARPDPQATIPPRDFSPFPSASSPAPQSDNFRSDDEPVTAPPRFEDEQQGLQETDQASQLDRLTRPNGGPPQGYFGPSGDGQPALEPPRPMTPSEGGWLEEGPADISGSSAAIGSAAETFPPLSYPMPAPAPEPMPAPAQEKSAPVEFKIPRPVPVQPPPIPPPIPARDMAGGAQPGGFGVPPAPVQTVPHAPWPSAPDPTAPNLPGPMAPHPRQGPPPGHQLGPALSVPEGRGPGMPLPGAPQANPSIAREGAPPRAGGAAKPQGKKRRERAAAKTEAGQLAENIPRRMRVGRTERVEIRLAKAAAKAITEGMDGSGTAWRHDVLITQAMSVRVRAPDGGFFIETASPETQWIENNLGFASDDFASWRFHITPNDHGPNHLQIIVSARTIGTDGVAAETALPDQVIDVKVRRNYGRTFLRWAGWIIAAIAGGALARFGENGIDQITAYLDAFLKGSGVP